MATQPSERTLRADLLGRNVGDTLAKDWCRR